MGNMIEKPPYSKISYPSVPNKDFKWSSGSDVQAIWRKFGWTPPSEKMLPPPPEKFQEPLRRVR
jgi:hypothetical protein